jgi:glyoxylase-like metal-dependent hydrolase (beta-lactamase superfamily II)
MPYPIPLRQAAACFAAAFTLVATATARVTAQAGANPVVRTADPAKRGIALSEFPRVVKLADNVYGYEELRSPGFATVSMFVVGANGVLLADGQGNAQATQTMLDRIRAITTTPIRWYVVGSDHGDHTGGNAALPKGIRWIVHPASKAQLKLDSIAAMTGDRETIDLGGITVDVLFLGRAHTGGDLMVHVPKAKVLFMSEAYLNRVFPAMRSAYPTEWVRTVDRALAMDVDRYVAGHGFIEEPRVSREELVTFRRSLADVITEATRLHALHLSTDEAIRTANWGEYKDWFLADQQAPIAIRRVFDELDGKLAPSGR